jgi:anti-sigma28 factor (negative regulator of flagellin synthesis)
MRVDNRAIENASENGLRIDATASTASREASRASAATAGSDQVSLSGASDLVSLANNLTPAEKTSKMTQLKAMLGTGQYTASPSDVSKALVAEHLQTS